MGSSSPDLGGRETVTVRYWAGARAAAGVDDDLTTDRERGHGGHDP